MKKTVVFVAIVGITILVFSQRVAMREYLASLRRGGLPEAVSLADVQSSADTSERLSSTPTPVSNQQRDEVVPSPVPSEINLDAPFQSQAPFADWSMPYKEACEEATLIITDHYLRGTTLSKEEMRDEILSMVSWQEQNFGGHHDLPMAKVKEMGERMFDYHFELIRDLTIEKIKQELNRGRLVIVPTAGRELGNPYFRTPGPLYHMLVIKGYTKDGHIITNDPGTRHGADYVYKPSVIMTVTRDWDGDSPDGPRVGLVMYK